jgi:succinate dehydrogenase/fumarate reductase flavoprotein subunit
MAFDTASRGSFMVVDQYGKRFFDDSYNGHSSYLYFCYYDPLKGAYPRLPSFLIFDEAMRLQGKPLSSNSGQAGGITGAKTAKYNYHWSTDQSAEIEKGWIMKADTIADLVKAINARQVPNAMTAYKSSVKMDPANLVKTVDTFNGYARQGADPEFGRKRLAALGNGPFYATEVWPCGPNTQGGPRFNAEGQVLNPYGQPIKRLYKCGELGSIYGERYPGGGGNLSELLAFGRIVGKRVAAEHV